MQQTSVCASYGVMVPQSKLDLKTAKGLHAECTCVSVCMCTLTVQLRVQLAQVGGDGGDEDLDGGVS